MILPLVEPVTAVQPAGGGDCKFAKVGGEFQDPAWPAGHSLLQHYVYTAAPATGFHFVRFDIEWTHSSKSHSTAQEDTPYSATRTANPYDTSSESGAYQDIPGLVWSYDYNGFPGMAQLDINAWTSLVNVTAVFAKDATPTHLPVNSYNRSSPVRPVYYPMSGLPVADY